MFPGKIYTDQLKRLLVLMYALPIVYNSCAVQIQSVDVYHVLLNLGFSSIRLLRLLHLRKLTRRGKYILTVNVALLIM